MADWAGETQEQAVDKAAGELRCTSPNDDCVGLESRTDKAVETDCAKKGNHRPRSMGHHGSLGNGICRAGAASTEAPTAHPNGRNQEAVGCRLPAWDRQPASRPGKVQVVPRSRSTHHLSRIRPRGRTGLKAISAAHDQADRDMRDHALPLGASWRGTLSLLGLLRLSFRPSRFLLDELATLPRGSQTSGPWFVGARYPSRGHQDKTPDRIPDFGGAIGADRLLPEPNPTSNPRCKNARLSVGVQPRSANGRRQYLQQCSTAHP